MGAVAEGAVSPLGIPPCAELPKGPLARACDKSERMDLADGLANLVVSRRRLAAA